MLKPRIRENAFVCPSCNSPTPLSTGEGADATSSLVCADCDGSYSLGKSIRPETPDEGETGYEDSPFKDRLVFVPWPWVIGQGIANVLRYVNVHLVSVASVVVGVIALLFGAWWESGLRPTSGVGWVEVGVALLAIVVLVFLIAHRSFDKIPPSDYARSVLEGRRVDGQFRWVAWRMHQLCTSFLSTRYLRGVPLRRLEKLGVEIGTMIEKAQERKEPASKILELVRTKFGRRLQRRYWRLRSLQKSLVKRRRRIQRVLRMKEILAAELDIHHRRLCDHVFRFSPSIFERRSRKYISNWWSIYDGLRAGYIPINRVLELLDENRRIVRRIQRRRNYLRLLTRSSYLFNYVQAFAARSSVRSSLVAYSRGIAQVTRTLQKYRFLRRVFWFLPAGDEAKRRYKTHGRAFKANRGRFIALYLMQRAHPGIDVHRTLHKLCKQAEQWCEAKMALQTTDSESVKKLEKQRVVWRHRADELGVLMPPLLDARGRPAEPTHRFLESSVNAAAETDVQDRLRGFIGLGEGVIAAIDDSQWVMNNRAAHVLRGSWIEGVPTLIVTVGYSKAVRDILKTVVFAMLQPSDRVFVIRPEGAETAGRMMEFELREDRGWFRPLKSPQVGAGEGKLLKALHNTSEPLQVMVLLSGECFDWQGRVVQTAEARKELDKVCKWATDAKIFLVAEGYRFYPDLSEIPGFYRDDLDDIGLYDARKVTDVIGDYFVPDRKELDRYWLRKEGADPPPH